jgi:dephospho-CoA kinase
MKKKNHHFVRVGVTGGIGSGKTVVCNLFASRGRLIISADDLARKLVDTDTGIRSAIVSEFGPSTYLPSGLLDRKAIAATVFSNKKKLERLNAIVHPRVFAAIDSQLESTPREKLKPFVIIEAALVYESGMETGLDYVIVVAADKEESIRRVARRDGLTRDQILKRMENQISPEQKVKRADFVIRNGNSLDSLTGTVEFLDRLLTQTYQRDQE